MNFEEDVQASWEKHGEAAFTYEILEAVTEADVHVLQRVMPERSVAWREKLGAGTIKGN